MGTEMQHNDQGEGPRGACADAVAWVRDRLFDDASANVRQRVALGYEKLSRFDLHIDWQGGWHPSPKDGIFATIGVMGATLSGRRRYDRCALRSRRRIGRNCQI